MAGSGLDRAGYIQIAKTAKAVLITSTKDGVSASAAFGVKNARWAGFEVVSSNAAIALVTASNITGSSLITSGAALPLGSYIGGGDISVIKVSTDSTGHKVMAYERVLL